MFDSLKILIPILSKAWDILITWWWLPMPFILWSPFCFLWKWWRTEGFLEDNPSILLEIKIPKEVLKPIRAMETVLNSLWQILYDGPDSYEKWIDGKVILSYSFEIASIDGQVHFYIRFPKSNRDSVEASIYAQYPTAEISEVEDYTKNVPQDIPNKEWDLWGADYKALMKNPYPIKTYVEFETEREALEEKRIDPLAPLLESMAKINPGEQFWIQILASPVTDMELPWVTEGKEIRNELAMRNAKKRPNRPLILEAADVMITGVPPGDVGEAQKELLPPEMKLTSGERDIITAIEKKITKLGFNTSIRFIYLGKRDIFFKPKLRLALGFFSQFSTQNLNTLVPHGQPLITKIKKSWFFPKNLTIERRLYLRKRAIFRIYTKREAPFFPADRRWPSSFVLNTEELASIFHFPGRMSAPGPSLERIEAKKGEAPPGLPM
jgi:hypothetical protein